MALDRGTIAKIVVGGVADLLARIDAYDLTDPRGARGTCERVTV